MEAEAHAALDHLKKRLKVKDRPRPRPGKRPRRAAAGSPPPRSPSPQDGVSSLGSPGATGPLSPLSLGGGSVASLLSAGSAATPSPRRPPSQDYSAQAPGFALAGPGGGPDGRALSLGPVPRVLELAQRQRRLKGLLGRADAAGPSAGGGAAGEEAGALGGFGPPTPLPTGVLAHGRVAWGTTRYFEVRSLSPLPPAPSPPPLRKAARVVSCLPNLSPSSSPLSTAPARPSF